MINTIGGIVIMVSDQAQAVKFYTEKIGFDIRLNVPFYGGKWIEVAPKDSESTLSIMEPNSQMMSPDELELAKRTKGKNKMKQQNGKLNKDKQDKNGNTIPIKSPARDTTKKQNSIGIK